MPSDDAIDGDVLVMMMMMMMVVEAPLIGERARV